MSGLFIMCTGIILMFLVQKICDECNTYQLWKGKIEKYLSILDMVGLCTVVIGLIAVFV